MMCLLFQFLEFVYCVCVCVWWWWVYSVRSWVAKYKNGMYIILINALISGRTLSKESGIFFDFLLASKSTKWKKGNRKRNTMLAAKRWRFQHQRTRFNVLNFVFIREAKEKKRCMCARATENGWYFNQWFVLRIFRPIRSACIPIIIVAQSICCCYSPLVHSLWTINCFEEEVQLPINCNKC